MDFLVKSLAGRFSGNYWAHDFSYSEDIREAKVYSTQRNPTIFATVTSPVSNYSIIFVGSNKHKSLEKINEVHS
ncbi:hypothetical protein [Vibrio phage vB_VpaP_SJSY21]|nr:hypothetical protein [Vibrio phage vB_VpaP_SJSY21]